MKRPIAPVVLMYHGLADIAEQASRYVMPAHRFAQQMAWLRHRRYTIVSLTTLYGWLQDGRPMPARSVVVPGTRPRQYPAGEFQVGCALIVGQRTASTDQKTSLNQALRDFGIST